MHVASKDSSEIWGKIPRSNGPIILSIRGGVVARFPLLARTAMQSFGLSAWDIRFGATIRSGVSLRITIGMNLSSGIRMLVTGSAGVAFSVQVWRMSLSASQS